MDGLTDAGTGGYHKKESPLSSIIEVLNKTFGTDFTEADRLFLDQIEMDIMREQEIIKAARSNTMDNFRFAFDEVFLGKVIDRMGMNDKIFGKLMDEPEFQNTVKNWMLASVYRKLNGEESSSIHVD